jgi:stage II sporulation protein D
MKLKPLLIFFICSFVLILLLPAALVMFYPEEEHTVVMKKYTSENANEKDKGKSETPQLQEEAFEVAVYRTETGAIETIPLEKYVIGVVASEMPAEFEVEALKAQAVAVRTYILKQLLYPTSIQMPTGADITDSKYHQVYRNFDQYQTMWGADYNWKMNKITTAVFETEGQILIYDGEPITASFFSTSNGYTVNAEDYWKNEIPYLKSVESKWDVMSPKYEVKQSIPVSTFEQKLNVSLDGTSAEVGNVLEKTSGNRIGKINIAGKIYTGREVREILGLYSTDFTMRKQLDKVYVTTKGYGHGVGMSQYGANGMALEGYTYEDILKYYYKGVQITSVEPFLTVLKK